MSSNLPPPIGPDSPLSPLDQPQQPSRSGLRWIIVGLVVCALIAVVSVGVLGYIAVDRKVKNTLPGGGQIPAATPPGQCMFHEVERLFTPAEAVRLAASDVTADGEADIAALAGQEVLVYNAAGKIEDRFVHQLPARPTTGGPSWGPATPPVIDSDLQVATIQDEPAVVLAASGEDTVYVLRADGTPVFENAVSGTGVTCLRAADLDGDGADEILVGRDSQIGLSCLDDSGNQVWRYGSTLDPHSVAVADADGNREPELFVAYLYAAQTEVLNADGQRLTQWPFSRGESDIYAGDLDGDGTDELLLLAPQTGSGSGLQALQLALISVDSQGTEQWSASIGSGLALTPQVEAVAADLDGNGEKEWVTTGIDGTVRVYDKNGTEIGRQAFGTFIYAMAVAEPDSAGGNPTVWVSLGQQVVGLEWTQWIVAQTTPASP